MAALDAWKTYGVALEGNDLRAQYELRYAFWAGTWRTRSDAMRRLRRDDPDLYVSTRQLWRHADAIVSLYEQFVYAGDLSTDGGPLPDGTRGAIPLDLQTGSQTSDDQLRVAIAHLWDVWRFRQMMGVRPKFGAIFGDCLTELVDDLGAGFVFPRIVTPDAVVDLELNHVGDVRAYAVEYRVPGVDRTIYGRRERTESFTFRKEVDGEAFRYFRNDKPAAIPEWGIPRPVEPNPYGFVPAIWDRHEVVPGVRGMSALERTLQQAMETNSVLSHAIDYQRKQFSAPIGVVGGAALPDSSRRAAAVPPSSEEEMIAAQRAASQSIGLIPLAPGGQFVSIQADVGKTTDLLRMVLDSMQAEAPESSYGQQILEMTQVTAPGIERALGPIVGRLKRARGNYDPQTVKLFQMAVAMVGWRLGQGDYPADRVRLRSQRYEAFRPFDLTSYGRGLLDFGIADREVIPTTPEERVEYLLKVEGLTSRWALRRAGLSEEEVEEVMAEREARRLEMAEDLTGIPAGEEDDGGEAVPDRRAGAEVGTGEGA